MDGFPTLGIPDTGDTAWMLVSSAMVLLMTPGLAFFYGGMVRAKSVLNMIMMSVSAMGVVTVLWVLYGYSLAFGNDVSAICSVTRRSSSVSRASSAVTPPPRSIADPAAGRRSRRGDAHPAGVHVPGHGVRRVPVDVRDHHRRADLRCGRRPHQVRRRGCCSRRCGSTFVYFPIAHWVFSFDGGTAETGGWIANKLAAIDFAGGTAVHINAGTAALVLVLILGKRKGWPTTPMRPHNLPFVMLGAGLLWFGWYGFNAGSATASNGTAGSTMVTTTVATAAAMLAWLLTERIRDGKATSLGAASGIVAGLVAITPSCGAVNVVGALVIGVVAGVLCALAVGLKYKLGYDDSLDVVGVHLVGGLTGTLLIGLVAAPETYNGVAGLFYGGGFDQLWRQAVGAGAVLLYCAIATAILAFIVKFTVGLRLSDEDEAAGADESEHAETAYDFAAVGGGSVLGRHGGEE